MRRRLALLACLALPAPARAFRIEPAAPDVARDYAERACAAPDPERRDAPPRALCPFCGCTVAPGQRDHGERR